MFPHRFASTTGLLITCNCLPSMLSLSRSPISLVFQESPSNFVNGLLSSTLTLGDASSTRLFFDFFTSSKRFIDALSQEHRHYSFNMVASCFGLHDLHPSFSEVMGIPLPSVDAVDAILFDVDGTLCDSDPLHLQAFCQMLQEVGFQADVPIDEEFFTKRISGKHNIDIGVDLFPDWDQSRRDKFIDDKEALFRSLAVQHLRPVEGLDTLCKWIEKQGLRRAAVTNAPPENAKLMISLVGLTDFFELVVLGSDCERPKPFPDPYLKALKLLGVSPERTFAFEDSASGLKAAVAAGVAGVGVTTRNPEDSLLKAGASLVVKDFRDPKLWCILDGQPQNEESAKLDFV